MATKQRFQFKLQPGWETQYMDHAEQGTHADIIGANMEQAFVQDLSAQLNDEYRDRSSPEYQKYQEYIPKVAHLFSETFILHFVHKHGIVVNKPIDELFDSLGCEWVRYDQFEEALSAFMTCVEISKGEGCWWQQKLCARYIHLAFVHMALGNKQEQLRASMHAAAFAVAAKNSASDSTICPSLVFNLSFLNLAAQFVGFNPDIDITNQFREDTLQAWEKHVAERMHTLQEKLDSGRQEVTSEVDLWYALSDFLVHSNRDSIITMLEILKSSLSESLSASELVQSCDLVAREFKFLMKVCQRDTLKMTLGATQAENLRTNLNFVLDLLEVASTLAPPSDQCEGWSISFKPMVSLYTGELGEPCYPGFCFLLFIEQDSAPNDFDSNCDLATRNAGGIATPVIAEGSNYEEFAAIQKKFESKSWNLADPSDFQEFVNLVRDLGLWATASSTVAVAPVHNIKIALNTVLTLADTVRQFPHNQHAAKSMLQVVVLRLSDQFNAEVKELSMLILLKYAQICDAIGDAEEGVNCCMKGLRLAEEHNMQGVKLGFHFFLGSTHLSLHNANQARKELEIARDIMKTNPDLDESAEWKSNIEGAEGCLELLECQNARNIKVAEEHCEKALKKLTTSLQLLEESQPSRETYHFKFNFMNLSMRLSDALWYKRMYAEALAVCIKAFQEAKRLKLTKELKFSNKLKLMTTQIAHMCGYQAQFMGNFVPAEDFFREGLQELQELGQHGNVDDFMVAKLYGGLGRTLLRQDKLPEAEGTLRKAIEACSRAVMERDLTSQARILTFELLQHCYNDLQLCLYAAYMQAAECKRGEISVDALVAAERGRCRDLTFTLEEILKSRIIGNENVSIDHSMDEMDWKKFDTDRGYAWGHLKNCMAKCTDAIKEQNREVQRVAFVEYTLTNQHMLIWVLHSHGTQEPSMSQETTLPSMYAVEVKTKFKEDLTDHRHFFEDNFKWIYGPHQWDFHCDYMIQYVQASEAVFLFENQIEQLRKDHEPRNSKLNELYDLLISPIADKLAIDEPVIFIPHEGLSFVPFAALKPKAPKAKALEQKEPSPKHFIEDHPVGYASSLRTLGWATNQYTALKANSTMSTRNAMLLVADPFPLGVEKDPLKDAIEEVNKITEMLPPKSTVTLEREQATLENVTSAMKTASWFHIACHGEVSSEEYPQGVLFLSCSGDSNLKVEDSPNCSDSMTHNTMHSPSSNGDLECKHRLRGCFTSEVLTDNVRCMTAQAAVLSACKVGLGKKTGEGLLGLSRAFMKAGVPLVIAPLRTLDSRLGSAFMQTFYRRMVAGESVMFALRNTMVDVIQKKIEVLDVKDDDDEVEDEVTMIKWQLWDWAAWVAVGFPGVCLPLTNNMHVLLTPKGATPNI